MSTKQHIGRLTVGYGPMFSGKTSWLIREYGNGVGAIAFKPDIDKRYTAKAVLASHNHRESPAILLSLSELSIIVNEAVRAKKRGGLKKILIDESNFFPNTIIDIVQDVLSRGVDVMVAGLLTDSERKDFGPTRALTQIADEVLTFTAKCDFEGCTTPALFTYAKKKKESQVVVGAADMYGASCDHHYETLHYDSVRLTARRNKLLSYGVYPGFIPWLENMSMPFERVKRAERMPFPHIEVGGDSMRIGKTTALSVMTEYLTKKGMKVKLSLEDWQNNPHLTASYGDSSDVLTDSQIWFARRKFEQLSLLDQSQVFIQDVHPEMDFCYALANVLMGRMTLKQFERYVSEFYRLPWAKIPAPDLLIYLKASDDALVDRAQRTSREFETIDPNYFLIMKAVNRLWLKKAKVKYRVLEIDTDDFDYSKEEESKRKLGALIEKKLNSLGWSMNPQTQELWQQPVNESWEQVIGKQLIVLSGLPGAGKTYWALRLKKEKGYSYLSGATIEETKSFQSQLKRLEGNDPVKRQELLQKALHTALLRRLNLGKRVVVDATYLGTARSDLLLLLKKSGHLSQTAFLLVRASEDVIRSRVSQKPQAVISDWEESYRQYSKRLMSGEIRFPDPALDGVMVVEVWNN